jgi:hypothetical protein
VAEVLAVAVELVALAVLVEATVVVLESVVLVTVVVQQENKLPWEFLWEHLDLIVIVYN